MVSILLIQLSGCYSYKTISSSDLPQTNSIKNTYIIHGHNSKYRLENTIISNGILLGQIDTADNTRHLGGKIHVYLLSDSVMKINTGNILSIPLDGIAKVDQAKVNVIGTITLSLGVLIVVVGGVGLALYLIAMSNMSIHM
jgi:hypothetical protein